MLDIKRIRQNPQELRDALKARTKDISIDEFLAQDEQRRKLLVQVETMEDMSWSMSAQGMRAS